MITRIILSDKIIVNGAVVDMISIKSKVVSTIIVSSSVDEKTIEKMPLSIIINRKYKYIIISNCGNKYIMVAISENTIEYVEEENAEISTLVASDKNTLEKEISNLIKAIIEMIEESQNKSPPNIRI